MSKERSQTGSKTAISRYAREGLGLFGGMIRAARIQRGMTAAELASRAGVSRGVVQRTEAGDPGVAIGSVFEMASILGIPLFDADLGRLGSIAGHQRDINALLPKRAFQASQSKPDNDF